MKEARRNFALPFLAITMLVVCAAGHRTRCAEDADCERENYREDPRFPSQPPLSSNSEGERVPCATPRCNASTGACYFELLDCDDQDECTRDECFGGEGCHHRPIDGLMIDMHSCVVRSCDKETGKIEETPKDCDDNNSCTVDVCVRGECHNIPPKFVDRECEEEKKKHKHHEDDDFEHHGHGHGDEDEEEEEEEEENSRYHPRDPHDDVDDEHRGHGHGDVDENLPHPPPSHDKDGPDCDEEHFRCHRYDTECRVDECMVFECTCPEEGEFEWHPAPRGVLCNEWDECGRFECNGRGSCVFKDGAENAECSAHGENVALGITLAVVIPVVALLIYCLLIFFGGGRRGLRERQASSVGRWED